MNIPSRNAAQKTPFRSLTVQWLTLIVLPLTLFVLVLTIGSTTLHQNAMRDMVGERDERMAQMAAQAIADQIEAREHAVRGLSLLLPVVSESGGMQAEEFRQIFEQSAYREEMFDMGLLVADRNGVLLESQGTFVEFLKDEPNILLEGIQSLQSDDAPPVFVAAAFRVPGSGKLASVVLAPGRDHQLVVGGAFFIDVLAERTLASAFAHDHSASVLILDQNRQVLYQKGFHDPQEVLLQHAGVEEALAGKTGKTYTNAQTGEHVVAFTSIDRMQWGLLIEEPWAHVTSPLLETTRLAPLAMIPVLLLAFFVLLISIRQIVLPLQTLAKQAASLGWGDYAAIEQTVGGIEEIRSLQRELVHMARKVQAAQRNLHSFIGAITAGQEEERRRLARELHDETIQSLIVFKQRIQLAEMDLGDQPAAKSLHTLEAAAEQTIEDVRRMVRALRPIYLEDLGLVAALDVLISETRQTASMGVTFDRQGKERRLDPAVELALYRIVQEALSNIARHAEASQASIKIRYEASAVIIEIEDDGKGFQVPGSPAEFAPAGHFGLLGMYERAELVGGQLRIHSAPGEGTRLVIAIPGDAGREIA